MSKGTLVLSRRVNESLIIGDGQVKIQITEVNGQQVRLAVTAPKEVSIHREEIYDRIKSNEIASIKERQQ